MNDSMENNETKSDDEDLQTKELDANIHSRTKLLYHDSTNATVSLMKIVDMKIELAVVKTIKSVIEAKFDKAFDQYDKALKLNQLIDDRIDSRDLICRDDMYDEMSNHVDENDQIVKDEFLEDRIRDVLQDMDMRVTID